MWREPVTLSFRFGESFQKRTDNLTLVILTDFRSCFRIETYEKIKGREQSSLLKNQIPIYI